MVQRSRLRPLLRGALLAALAGSALLLGGCDNPACVFGGDCSSGGSGGGLGSEPASVPADHTWLAAGAPTLVDFFPRTGQIASTTAVALVFSESMAPGPLQAGVRLVQVGGFGAPVLTLPPTLVGDGRMLLLVPVQPLTAGATYELRYVGPELPVTDLQGTSLVQPSDALIGAFTVAASDPTLPRLVASWPLDNATGQSPTGEMVAVFDRRMDAATVTSDSFQVTVDGQPPAFDPPPQPVLFVGGSAFPTSDTRAFRYRSVDAEGEAAPLALAGEVQVTLSPTGDKILSELGAVLAETVVDFDLAAFGPPLGAEIVSVPMDAVGIDNLNGVRPLEVAVQLSGAQATDRLGVFLFGESKAAQPQLIALFREVQLSAALFDPVGQVATLGEAELQIGADGDEAVFADGQLALAFRLARGNAQSPVKLLDTDDSLQGTQHAIVDTTRPTLTGLGTSGTSTLGFRSDFAGFALVGRANERLRSVEVSTPLGDNGLLAPVVASNEAGLFVAAPVRATATMQPLGILDPAQLPLAFSAVLYDRALNRASATVNASFTQLGASGPGAALPAAGVVDVEVYDARTLAAVASALVVVHQEQSGSSTLVGTGVTDAAGRVSLASAAAGETIVTVDATGYDLSSFHGVPTRRLSLPLTRSLQQPGTVAGIVSSGSQDFTMLQRAVVDSRLPAAAEPTIAVQSCSFSPVSIQFECTFGPRQVLPGPLGAATVLGIDTPPSEFNYTAQGFLQAFALELPLAPVSPAQAQALDLASGPLLDGAGVDLERRALDGVQTSFLASGIAGLDLAMLSGGPRVSVQGVVPGMPGNATVGAAVAFPTSGMPTDTWKLRSAIPGVADPTDGKYMGDEVGELVAEGTLEPDLLLRCELRDDLGARTGRRPLFSDTVALLRAISAPVLTAPSGSSGGASYELVFGDVIADSLGQGGLYRATLVGTSGRRWVLQRLEPAGAGTVRIRVVDLAAAGGVPLPAGTVAAVVEVHAWAAFDRALFAWSEVPRRHDAYAVSAPVSYTVP